MQFTAADLERLAVEEKVFAVAGKAEHGRAGVFIRAMGTIDAYTRAAPDRCNPGEPGYSMQTPYKRMFHNVRCRLE
ncbi:hypothetical protein [Paraburkholderia adhaesiva]|uniref:hypothetical protein n=1 Tax=Paraburkholderia adhaesiva TaxID=2883244 RepID=UPI001F19E055|nr:hypothetical protein [Paraburkholderia adhaesiva]